MNNILVSVIIPTYNRCKLLQRSINSVLNQTHKNLEIIVVDDNSNDGTANYIGSLNDKRIVYFRHDRNKGGSAARNTGIINSNGEYISFLDSDDEWLPNKLERQLLLFEKYNSDYGVVGCGRKLIEYKNNKQIEYDRIPRENLGDINKKLLKGLAWPNTEWWPGGTPAVIIKKKCFKKIGLFDESLPAAQEHDLYIRLSKHFKFAACKEVLFVGHMDAKSRISTNLINQINGKSLFLKKHQSYLPLISYLKSNFLFTIGIIHLSKGDKTEGRKNLFKSFLAYPLFWQSFILFFVSYTSYINKYIKKNI